MNLKIEIHLSTKVMEWDIDYPKQNKISFPLDPKGNTIGINKIILNGIETNKFYNTSLLIDGSDVVLTSIHEVSMKGVFTLELDDLYILSHRSNNWHCATKKHDYIFQYEFTNDSFTNWYRDRDHKGFGKKFIPCFGCSNTYGSYQSASDTWPFQLSQRTGANYLNMGVSGSGVDGIYHNLKLLHKRKGFDQCLILFPNFERRVVRCAIDDKYMSIYSTVDLSHVTSEYSFCRNKRLLSKMQEVRDNIIKDVKNRYSKRFLNKIIDYCKQNNIDLFVSSWVDEVYQYLQQQRDKMNFTMLPRFPKLSLFTERADDGAHPHRKHYEYFADEIVKTL